MLLPWLFPLNTCKGIPVNPHPGAFGYPRREARHTGVDLYTEEGAPVLAVEEGIIVCIEPFTGILDDSPWWNNTDCILVEGRSGVVCYGEVTVNLELKVGERVCRGDYLGNVKRVIKIGREHPEITGWSPSMLHLELYPKGTKRPSCGFEKFLQDPTLFLINADHKPAGLLTVVYNNYKPANKV